MSEPLEPRVTTPRSLRIEIAPKTIFLLLGVVAGIWMLGQLTTVFSVLVVAAHAVAQVRQPGGVERVAPVDRQVGQRHAAVERLGDQRSVR